MEFVRQLCNRQDNIVFALVRNPDGAKELTDFVESASNHHKNVQVIQADLDSVDSIKSAAKKVAENTGGTLDNLINNAAKMRYERFSLAIDSFPNEKTLEDDFLDFFKTNVVGTTHVINAFLPLLKAAKAKNPSSDPKVATVTSGLGSVSLVDNNMNCAYSTSKAALNLVIAKFAVRFKNEGIIFYAINPGLVKTLDGRKPEEIDALYKHIVETHRKTTPSFCDASTPEESVKDQFALMERVKIQESGTVFNRDGSDGLLQWGP